MDDANTKVLRMLDACLRGEALTAEQLSALDASSDLPPPLASAVHELHHFADDADLRSRDPEYVEHWRQRLEKIRARLSGQAT
jgi:hypothetical protein